MSTEITEIQITVLFLYAVATCGAIYISLIFFSKIKRPKDPGFDVSVFIGLGIFFFLSGIMYIFWFYYYFYIFQLAQNESIIYFIAFYLGYSSVIALVYFSERMLGKTKFIITLLGIISILCAIIFIPSIEDLQIYSYISLFIFALAIFFSFIISIKYKTKGAIRRKMILAIICAFIFYCFYFLDTDAGKALLPIPGEIVTIIATIGIIITAIIWGFIFASFETFTEFHWREKLKELYIIAPNGAMLFHYQFETQLDDIVTDLITAGLTGIKELLAEIIRSDKALKVVDHQDLKIIFEYGKYSTLALITYENLRIYHAKLTQLIKQFENLFDDVLNQWNGDIEVFLPSKKLIEEIF